MVALFQNQFGRHNIFNSPLHRKGLLIADANPPSSPYSSAGADVLAAQASRLSTGHQGKCLGFLGDRIEAGPLLRKASVCEGGVRDMAVDGSTQTSESVKPSPIRSAMPRPEEDRGHNGARVPALSCLPELYSRRRSTGEILGHRRRR